MTFNEIAKTVLLAQEHYSTDSADTRPSWLRGDFVHLPSAAELGSLLFSSSEEFDVVDNLESESVEGHDPSQDGLELLAWYTSFRSFGRNKWGIFIRTAGVETLASVINPSLRDPALAREIAFKFLLEHEITHFRVDASIASAELLAQKSIYREWRQTVGSWPQWSIIEEGLCNSHALEVAPKEARESLRTWMLRGPSGYNDFESHKRSPKGRRQSWSRLFTEVSSHVGNSAVSFLPRTRDLVEVPDVFLVQEVNRPLSGVIPISFMGALTVRETDDFKKSLKKSGDSAKLAQRWEKAKLQIESGQRTPGLNLEQYSKNVFTVRLNRQIRAVIRVVENGVAEVVSISQQHDSINKSAAMMNG